MGKGWRYGLACLSGALFVLSFPTFDLWPLGWVALIPLLVAIDGVKPKEGLKLGWICGAIYFSGMTYWILPLYPYANIPAVIAGMLLLTGYLSSYIAAFAWAVRWVDPRSGISYALFCAAVWTALELIRGWLFTGLPWGSLGHSQYKNLPIAQIASITGVGGISFLMALTNASIAHLLLNLKEWRSRIKTLALPLALIALSLCYGLWTLARPIDYKGEIKIALLPGNVKQWEKMYVNPLRTFSKYLNLLDSVIPEKPDLIVMPETHVLMDLLNPANSSYLKLIQGKLRESGSYLLFGIPHTEEADGEYLDYNAAILLSPEGEVVGKYYKQHLVPISEYLPFRRYLPESIVRKVAGVADFAKGKEDVVFTLPNGARFGVVICFESVFPNIFRRFIRKGVDFMGIITNDAWFEGTSAPYQHYAMAPFRAIETRKAIFRCANKGVTCVIDPKGRVISGVVKPDEDEVLIAELPLHPGTTIYARLGEWLPLSSLAGSLIYAFAKKHRRKQHAQGEI